MASFKHDSNSNDMTTTVASGDHSDPSIETTVRQEVNSHDSTLLARNTLTRHGISAPLPDQIGKYRIIRKLGEGGMGFVYLAEDPDLSRKVAIKVIRKEVLENLPDGGLEVTERFSREARALARLNNPNIISIYELENVAGQNHIVMEYVEGMSLRDVIDQNSTTLDEKCDYIRQLGQALQAAHDDGIVHRDIKPTNVLISREGQVKLMDFGLVHEMHSELTRVDHKLGTPSYMSPEQFINPKSVDKRSDIFSLGILFYELLTGEKPFPGKHFHSISHRVIIETPTNPSQINPLLGSKRVDQVLLKALQKSPLDRYQNCIDFVNELLTVLSIREDASSPETSEQTLDPVLEMTEAFHRKMTMNPWFVGDTYFSLNLLTLGLYQMVFNVVQLRSLISFIELAYKENNIRSMPMLSYASLLITASGIVAFLYFLVDVMIMLPTTIKRESVLLVVAALSAITLGTGLFLTWMIGVGKSIDEWKIAMTKKKITIPESWKTSDEEMYGYLDHHRKSVSLIIMMMVNIYLFYTIYNYLIDITTTSQTFSNKNAILIFDSK